MGIYIGCDVGTVSVKAAVVIDRADGGAIVPSGTVLKNLRTGSALTGGIDVFVSPYRRIKGNPVETALEVLRDVASAVPREHIKGLCFTGSGGKLIADSLRSPMENEFKSASRGVGLLNPDVEFIFEMGGENSKFLNISVDRERGDVGIVDYETNGDCAAGTGSFMDQQASRLRYDIEDVGGIVTSCGKSAKIAGRCSVFAKSDMIHAQQKGATPPEVLKGLCEAVARNFKGNIAKGKDNTGKTAFIGGVAHNRGVVEALEQVFEMDQGSLVVPEEPAFYSAIGAALLQRSRGENNADQFLRLLDETDTKDTVFPAWEPLTLRNVRLLRNEARPYEFPADGSVVNAFLGIDIGSVSTNLVCIDDGANVIHEIYVRTNARPVEVVGQGLKEIEEKLGKKIRIMGVGTTGSGRELIGELIGADTINDEITAHKTGAFEIARRYIDSTVDTIFEIGGQDSKFISLQDGIVVDFTMNEACAAGTGSFLEEQAEKLNVNIIDEFSRLAFEARNPIRLGERCTVYMEQDITSYQQKGAGRQDLIAGLSYSVVQNYLNRVVRGRHIGDVIFFQGGTAYNDSVAAAFSQVLGKQIIVPPHNGVVGAYGVALLAREKVLALAKSSMFRGYDIEKIDYRTRDFTCKACANFCDVQEFTVEGNKTYWGDKCSDRYRKEAKTPKEPVIEDLPALREESLMYDYFGAIRDGELAPDLRAAAVKAAARNEAAGSRGTVGYPRAMYFYERFPFWHAYFRALGFDVIISDPTTKQLAHLGIEEAVAEPCYPIQVAHGHVAGLLRTGADYYFLPNVVNAETNDRGVQSYMCPWGQTLPFIIASAPVAKDEREKILAPLVHFREGEAFVERELWNAHAVMLRERPARGARSARKQHAFAVACAYRAQREFQRRLREAGRAALETLGATGEIGIIIVGRPYNIYDKGINMNIPSKLRKYYGVNVIPLDFLPLDEVGVRDINDNMFWSYGRKILQAARLTSQDPNLHIIYITNFKCGPDSYVKQFAELAAVKPFLTLQFDGHGNDAGMMTRCEAYLDSKGVLRWWKQSPSKDEPSISPGCPMEEREHSLPLSGR
jgi:predicted CoA-substrate-specific enzyme activase